VNFPIAGMVLGLPCVCQGSIFLVYVKEECVLTCGFLFENFVLLSSWVCQGNVCVFKGLGMLYIE
jgi:hypothetical protein